MTLIVNCAICEKQIEKPMCSQLICKNKECQITYQRFLVWQRRENLRKAKDYKVLKIIKNKVETK